MPDRSKDWLAQAERDLNHAIDTCGGEHFEWSCFSYYTKKDAEEAINNARKIVEFCTGRLRR